MNPEVKAQWVQALRSGDYDQGRGFLQQIDDRGKATYCCLGVLCDLAVKAGVTTGRTDRNNSGKVMIFGSGYDCFPPLEVWQWAGFSNDNPEVNVPGLVDRKSVVDLNDNGTRFSEIADRIEESL